VLSALPIDWMVVVVEPMISDTTDPEDQWHNLFLSMSVRTVLVSTFDLRRYASEGRRPFECALFGVALAGLLSGMVRGVGFEAGVGGIFDFCTNRDGIVEAIRHPHIDAATRELIPRKLLEPTDAILNFLTQYRGSVTKKQIDWQLRTLSRSKRSTASGIEALRRREKTTSRASFTASLKALEGSLRQQLTEPTVGATKPSRRRPRKPS